VSTGMERLQTAQWVLERNLGWIAAAEVKVGVIVAINTGMLGGLGAAFSAAETATRTHWAWMFMIAASICLGGALISAAMAVLPRVTGPAKSFLFFGRIGPCADAEYIANFKSASLDDLLTDWTAQIHRNAQIACEKFRWVHRGMLWSFLAMFPWFAAILTLLHKS
jgi:hypothetical protein